MSVLVGDPPRTQLIASRLLQPGDFVARDEDATFVVVAHVFHATDAETVTIEFTNGALWLGTETTAFPVAESRQIAADWNRRLLEAELREATKRGMQ